MTLNILKQKKKKKILEALYLTFPTIFHVLLVMAVKHFYSQWQVLGDQHSS